MEIRKGHQWGSSVRWKGEISAERFISFVKRTPPTGHMCTGKKIKKGYLWGLVKKKWERVMCDCHSFSSQHSKRQKCVKLDGHSKDYLSFFWQICRCLRELQVEFRNPPVSASLLLGHRVQLHFDLITFFSRGLGSKKSNKNNCLSDRLNPEKKQIEKPIFDVFKLFRVDLSDCSF